MRYYLMHWKRIIDYKGVSTRQEYRVPLIVTAILAALTAVLWIVGSVEYADVLMGVGVVTGALFALHVIPMMALTVRRLRDAGKKPWLAVLSCLAGIGTLIVMLICLLSVSTTGELPFGNINACVYGPPPFDPGSNVNVDVYGPPDMFDDYDPEDNVMEAVYGPPEAFYDEEETVEPPQEVTENAEP
ncbi:MAG: DUF805 domain-containing protein [Clostridia bacterium]|nr:DUF805 domain-containing protein [Clostridia bacterium]